MKHYIVLFFIILLGLTMRLYGLDQKDLWFDERCSLIHATRINMPDKPMGERISGILRLDRQSPFYTIVLSLWLKMVPPTIFALRSLSVIFGILTILAAYLLGKELFSKATGLWVSLLTAISPIQLWYSQEIRTYTLNTALFIFFIVLLIRAIRKNTPLLWIQTNVAGIFFILTNYVSFFIALPMLTAANFLKEATGKRKKILLTIEIMGIAYLLMLLSFFSFQKLNPTIHGNFWIYDVAWRSIFFTILEFNLGYTGDPWYITSFILAAGIIILSILDAVKNHQSRDKILFLILAVFVPLLGIFLFSIFFVKIYLTRTLLGCSILYYCLLAISVKVNKLLQKLLLILFSILMGASCFSYYQNKGFSKEDPLFHYGVCQKTEGLKKAFNFFDKNVREEDIYAYASWSLSGADRIYSVHKEIALGYLPSKPTFPSIFLLANEGDKNTFIFKMNMLHDKNSIVDVRKNELKKYHGKRLWLFKSLWNKEIPEMNMTQALAWCNARFKLKKYFVFDGIEIYLYDIPPAYYR